MNIDPQNEETASPSKALSKNAESHLEHNQELRIKRKNVIMSISIKDGQPLLTF